MSSIVLRFLAEPHTVKIGDLVEVEARLAYAGTTSMNLSIEVRSRDIRGGEMTKTTECLVVFVSIDLHGRPMPVEAFTPSTPGEAALAERAGRISKRLGLRQVRRSRRGHSSDRS